MGAYRLDYNFPAVLRTADGEEVATGSASVSLEDRSVDFKSDFILLYRMGTPMQIVRLQNSYEVHSFQGEVYLSSPRLLRITSVTDLVLPGARWAFLFDVAALEGTVRAVLPPPERPTLRLRDRLSPRSLLPHEQTLTVQVHALSMTAVKFTCGELLEEGQTVHLHTKNPALGGIPVTVGQVIAVGQALNSYLCRIPAINGPARDNLDRYLAPIAQRSGKLFPDLPPLPTL